MSTSQLVHHEPLRLRDSIDLPTEAERVVQGRASRSESYPVFVTRSMTEALEHLLARVDSAQVAVITDETVASLYGEELLQGFRGAGIDPILATLPAGEQSKSVRCAMELWDWLASTSIARRDVIVTFGGGVINDLGGWVASGYMRGLPYVNLPTTLLAQVDGALGGKVAANHQTAKNLLGAFHQPIGVISNVRFLRTIEDRHLRAGLAEAIKKAIIASPPYWDFIDTNAGAILARDLDALERLVRCASAIKTRLIERDPYEEDLRRPLNFGHTIGHPLETVTGYGPLLHGEAVAFGMVIESRIAANRGLLPFEQLEAIIELLQRVGLPTSTAELPVDVDADAIVAAMEKVRLIRAGSLRFVLPAQSFGETVIADDVAYGEVRAALAASTRRHAAL